MLAVQEITTDLGPSTPPRGVRVDWEDHSAVVWRGGRRHLVEQSPGICGHNRAAGARASVAGR